jgi:hypothetical protein
VNAVGRYVMDLLLPDVSNRCHDLFVPLGSFTGPSALPVAPDASV